MKIIRDPIFGIGTEMLRSIENEIEIPADLGSGYIHYGFTDSDEEGIEGFERSMRSESEQLPENMYFLCQDMMFVREKEWAFDVAFNVLTGQIEKVYILAYDEDCIIEMKIEEDQ